MGVCKWCGQEYDVMMTHGRYCKVLIELRQKEKELLTKEFLLEEYKNKEKSIRQISEEYGVRGKAITSKLKEYNIHIRTSKESRKTQCFKNRTIATCRKRFGTDYANCNGSSVRQKQIDAVIAKYGVDNVRKSQAIKDKIKKTCIEKYGENYGMYFHEKATKTNMIRYGVPNPAQNSEVINKIKQSRRKNNLGCYSSPTADKLFSEILKFYSSFDGIYTHILGKEYSVMGDNNKLLCYDFVDIHKKKCIEFNGNYWHANPKIYNEDWICPHMHISAHQIWLNDAYKINTIKQKRNFDVLVIWEKDFSENPEFVINQCINFLGLEISE